MCEKYDLIIRNATIYTMDQDQHVIHRGSLAARGDSIARIGQEDLARLFPANQVIDADGSWNSNGCYHYTASGSDDCCAYIP